MNLQGNYMTERFLRLDREKQEAVFQAALEEFSSRGFQGANINTIAEKCGISIGSLYQYVTSKDNLFLALIDQGYEILESVLDNVFEVDGDIIQKIKLLISDAVKTSRRYRQWVQIYQDMTSEGLSHLAGRLSRRMETIAVRGYGEMIRQAVKNGEMEEPPDIKMLVFLLDNIILMLQFSASSSYFGERMKLFLGESRADDDEYIIQGTMELVKKLVHHAGADS